MATFEITEGAPGQGKSLYTARTALRLIERNQAWERKTGIRRIIMSNMRFSDSFEKEHEGYFGYWLNASELIELRNVDIIWDEIATEIDARNFANLSDEMKRFLSQYRKRGVDIYANTQDFSMIDARARLMITHVRTLRKVLGSPDISTTKPAPRWIWGLIWIRDVENFRETDPEKKKYGWVPDFFLITRKLIALYDTTQDIPRGNPPPLKHETRVCEKHGVDCQFVRVIHS